MPLEMTTERLKSKIMASPQSTPGKTPIPINKPGARDDEFDVSTELSGYGLQGVRVTEAELADLVAELGLDGDEAGDLVKGLSGGSSVEHSTPLPAASEPSQVSVEKEVKVKEKAQEKAKEKTSDISPQEDAEVSKD